MTYNAYEILGVPQTATEEEIKQAYRAKVKLCHPDQYLDAALQERGQVELTKLNVAYEEALRLLKLQIPQARVAPRRVIMMLPPHQAKSIALRMLSQGLYDSALMQLGRTQERDGEWYFIQGSVLMQKRQYAAAHTAYREAARLEPLKEQYHQAAFQAAQMVRKHQKFPYLVADWVGSLVCGERRSKGGAV